MIRRSHPAKWKPRPGRQFFIFWDVCRKCRRIQHYEENRRFVDEEGNITASRVAEKAASGRSLPSMRDEEAAQELCALLCLY